MFRRLSLLFAWSALTGIRLCAQTPPGTFQNPLKENGADPWLTWFEGSYYYTATAGTGVVMRSAARLADLRTAPDRLVWSDSTPSRSREIWAPECHLLPDESGALHWFLYYSASDGVKAHHRLYVAESSGRTPLGPYVFKAKLATDLYDAFQAIDATVLHLPDGRLYFLWCGLPAETGQGIYLSRMTNPWTLTGPRTYLRTSGFGCPLIREAPETLQHGGKVFLVYSSCDAATPDYKLGLLSADAGADLLKAVSWRQEFKPVFASAPQNGVWAPGHCFFFKSPDGAQDWIVYHAKAEIARTYARRSTRAQPFTWGAADGLPNFGVPVSTATRLAAPSGE